MDLQGVPAEVDSSRDPSCEITESEAWFGRFARARMLAAGLVAMQNSPHRDEMAIAERFGEIENLIPRDDPRSRAKRFWSLIDPDAANQRVS